MTVDRLIRFLVTRGHAVDLACFVTDAEEEGALRDGLAPICRRIDCVVLPRWASFATTALHLPSTQPMQVSYFQSKRMKRLVSERVERGDYDLVYTHLIRMAEYARDVRLPKVIGLQISQGLNLKRMVDRAADPARRLFYRIEERRVRPYEAQVCADFDRAVLCGRRDVEEIEKTAPLPNAIVCPHGQDVPSIERVRASPRVPGALVFSGVMATYTNVDAATWFAREIFPRIESEVPEASFWIVGRSPQRAVKALARSPRVVVTGEVPDVYDWLCRAAVAVDPLRIGAGMQNKVVQAMACELPIVATSEANEGIAARPGDEIVLQDSAEGFAAAVIALLRSPAERERIGRAARRFVETNWTWEAQFEKLEKLLRSVASA
jgi:sugar transferase (PEP-CTERM/EpsH1 system associated)